MLVEGVDGEGQIEATVERLALLLEGLHVAHRRSAKEQARLRVAAGAVQKGTQRAGQGRRGANQLRELVEHQQRWCIGGSGGEIVQGVVPGRVRPLGGVAQARRE